MVPVVLAEPVPVGRPERARSPVPARLALGVLLVIAGSAATVVWLAGVSPYGFARFSLLDADRTLTVRTGGTYLVFEEFAGASGEAPPLPVDVAVLDERGRPLAVTMLVDPSDPRGTERYHLPGHEGRAIARFEVPDGGRYLVVVGLRAPGTYPAELYRVHPGASIAIGREVATSWVGSPVVALAIGIVPVVVGVGLVVSGVVVRGRRVRTDPPSRPPPWAVPAASTGPPMSSGDRPLVR